MWFDFGSILSYGSSNIKKIIDSWKDINISNIWKQISEDFSEWKEIAIEKHDFESPFIKISENQNNLLEKIDNRYKEYTEIQSYIDVPFSDLNEFARNKIIEYNKPENILSKSEEFDYKNLIKKQKTYSIKREEVLWQESDNLTSQISESLQSAWLRWSDEVSENDTFWSKLMWSLITAWWSISNLPDDIKEDFNNYINNSRTRIDNENKKIKEIKENANLNILEKNIEYAKVNFDSFKEIIWWSSWWQFLEHTYKHSVEWMSKIWKWFTSDSFAEWISEIWAWSVWVIFSPITAFFEKDVTGSLWKTTWELMAVAITPIAAGTSQSLKTMWVDDNIAENWGIIAVGALPFIMKSWKNPWKVLANETAFLWKLPKEYQGMYVNIKWKVNKIDRMEVELQNRIALERWEVTEFLVKDKKWNYAYEPINKWISNIRKLTKDFIDALNKKDFKKVNEINTKILERYKILKVEKNSLFKERLWDYISWIAEKLWIKQNFLSEQHTWFMEVVKEVPIDITKVNIKPFVDFLNKDFTASVYGSVAWLRWNREFKDNSLESTVKELILQHDIFKDLTPIDKKVVVDNAIEFYKKESVAVKKAVWVIDVIQKDKWIYSKEALEELAEMWIEATKKDLGVMENLPEKIRAIEFLVKKNILKDNWIDPKNINLNSYWISKWSSNFFSNHYIEKQKQDWGIFHIPISELSKQRITKEIKDFDELIKITDKISETPLIKTYSNSRLTKTDFIEKQKDMFFKKLDSKKWQEIIMDLETSQAWNLIYTDGIVTWWWWSTFPKWIKWKDVRKTTVIEKVLEHIKNKNIDIKTLPEQKLMEQLMEQLWSVLKDIYTDMEFKNIKNEIWAIRMKKENFKKYKDYESAFNDQINITKKLEKDINILENEKNKVKAKEYRKLLQEYYNKVFSYQDKIWKLWEKLEKKDIKIKDLRQDLANEKTKRKWLRDLKKDYPSITNYTAKRIREDLKFKSLDLLTDSQFIDFFNKYEAKLNEYLDLQIEYKTLRKNIAEKGILHIENLFKISGLPKSMKDYSIKDFNEAQKIIDWLQQWDQILSETMLKSFSDLWKDVKTTREATIDLRKNIKGFDVEINKLQEEQINKIKDEIISKENSVEINTKKLNKNPNDLLAKKAIKEDWIWIKQLKSKLEDYQNKKFVIDFTEVPEYKKISEEIEILENDILSADEKVSEVIQEKIDNLKENQNKIIEDINDLDFKETPKETESKIKQNKPYKWSYLEKALYDTSFAMKDGLNQYVIESYKAKQAHYDLIQQKEIDTFNLLLSKARKDRGFKFINTDEYIIEFIEKPEKQAKFIEDGFVSKAEIEIAMWLISDFKHKANILEQRNALDTKVEWYVTHTWITTAEVLKQEWFKSALKNIFRNKTSELDFWSITWDGTEALWFTKWFKYAVERKWWLRTTNDLWRIYHNYSNAFYKKLAIDDVLPEAILYVQILWDSKKVEIIKSHFNKLKWKESWFITQWWTIWESLKFFRNLISIKDLWWNLVTVWASILWVINANWYILWARWTIKASLQKYFSKEARDIIKKYEWTLWRNALKDFKKEVWDNTAIPTYLKPFEWLWIWLSAVFQSWLNTAFIWLLTKEELSSWIVSDKRIAEIKIEMWKTHALPGTQSIWGSNEAAKTWLQYKWWGIPYAHRTIWALWEIITWNKKDKVHWLKELWKLSKISLLALWMYLYFTDEDSRKKYSIKRMYSEAVWAYSAADINLWSSVRMMWELESIQKLLKDFVYMEEYKRKSWKDDFFQYKKEDKKWITDIKKIITPWAIKWPYKVYKDIVPWDEQESGLDDDFNLDLDFELEDDIDVSKDFELDLDFEL